MSSTGNAAPTAQTPIDNKDGGTQSRSSKKCGLRYVQKSNVSSFEGENKDSGVVLGLITDRITKKVPFDVFQEKLVNCMVRTFKNGGDIVVGTKNMVDHMPLLKINTSLKHL